MEFTTRLTGRTLRIIAIVALLMGLGDAARLLGVGHGGHANPIVEIGARPFAYLSVFALAYLFAAVGLWIKASWGAALLVGATLAQLTLFVLGSPNVEASWFGFILRLALFIVVALLLMRSWLEHRRDVHD